MTSRDCRENGHCFKPRYDIVAPKWMEDETRRDWLVEAGTAIEHVFEKIYVHDICTRCGMKIERKNGTT